MQRFDDQPITEASEVEAFLDRAPFVVDRAEFSRFLLGFPLRYLKRTAPAEVLKHFTLVQSLVQREVISTLSRDGERWKLVVVTRDRRFLFSQISGSLSLFGANILDAEAIGNTGGLVLDVFRVGRQGHDFDKVPERRRFLKFLEEVVAGTRDLDTALAEHQGEEVTPAPKLRLEWDQTGLTRTTLLRVRGRDSPGILYRLTRGLSAADCDIDQARIETPEGEVQDEFQITLDGAPVPPERREAVARAVQASLRSR